MKRLLILPVLALLIATTSCELSDKDIADMQWVHHAGLNVGDTLIFTEKGPLAVTTDSLLTNGNLTAIILDADLRTTSGAVILLSDPNGQNVGKYVQYIPEKK